MRSMQTGRLRQGGMMMLEVLIALLIFAVGVLGTVKMQAVSTANSINSEDRTTAALLADDLIAQLWVAYKATPSTSPTAFASTTAYTGWQSAVSGSGMRGASGSRSVSGTTATVTITWSRQLGRNIEGGANASTDPEKTATYTTQVVLQ